MDALEEYAHEVEYALSQGISVGALPGSSVYSLEKRRLEVSTLPGSRSYFVEIKDSFPDASYSWRTEDTPLTRTSLKALEVI